MTRVAGLYHRCNFRGNDYRDETKMKNNKNSIWGFAFGKNAFENRSSSCASNCISRILCITGQDSWYELDRGDSMACRNNKIVSVASFTRKIHLKVDPLRICIQPITGVTDVTTNSYCDCFARDTISGTVHRRYLPVNAFLKRVKVTRNVRTAICEATHPLGVHVL